MGEGVGRGGEGVWCGVRGAGGGFVLGLGFAFGRFGPTRTTRAGIVVGCGWPLWGVLAVGGCGGVRVVVRGRGAVASCGGRGREPVR